MKIETPSSSVASNIAGVVSVSNKSPENRVLGDAAVIQGETVPQDGPKVESSGIPEIPPPGASSPGGNPTLNIQDLLMWIATMAAEYIKQQNELNQTRQKAVETGFKASIDAANKNYDKNMTAAIVGIVGSVVSLSASGFSAYKLGGAGKQVLGLKGQQGDVLKVSTTQIDHSTQVAQTVNAAASGTSQSIQSIGGTVSAGQEFDAKQQEALAQLIAKTAETITSNEGATKAIIEKFVNDLMALLKNFTAASVR